MAIREARLRKAEQAAAATVARRPLTILQALRLMVANTTSDADEQRRLDLATFARLSASDQVVFVAGAREELARRGEPLA